MFNELQLQKSMATEKMNQHWLKLQLMKKMGTCFTNLQHLQTYLTRILLVMSLGRHKQVLDLLQLDSFPLRSSVRTFIINCVCRSNSYYALCLQKYLTMYFQYVSCSVMSIYSLFNPLLSTLQQSSNRNIYSSSLKFIHIGICLW